MSSWEPHIDLMRLLEALGREIIAATELEVRQACAEDGWSMARAKLLSSAWPQLQVELGSSMARTAKEIRELIEAATGDPGNTEIGVEKVHFELRGSRHLQAPSSLAGVFATSSTECSGLAGASLILRGSGADYCRSRKGTQYSQAPPRLRRLQRKP